MKMLLEDGDRIEEVLTEGDQSIHRDPGKPPIAVQGDLQPQDQQIADDLDPHPGTRPLRRTQLAISQFKQAFTPFPEDFDPMVLMDNTQRFGGAQGLGQDEVGDRTLSFPPAKDQDDFPKGRADGRGAIDGDIASPGVLLEAIGEPGAPVRGFVGFSLDGEDVVVLAAEDAGHLQVH